MTGYLELKRGFGPSENHDEDDVIATKSALTEIGDYSPPGGRLTPWAEPETTEALKRLQRRNGLWPDGRIGGSESGTGNSRKGERRAGLLGACRHDYRCSGGIFRNRPRPSAHYSCARARYGVAARACQSDALY